MLLGNQHALQPLGVKQLVGHVQVRHFGGRKREDEESRHHQNRDEKEEEGWRRQWRQHQRQHQKQHGEDRQQHDACSSNVQSGGGGGDGVIKESWGNGERGIEGRKGVK